MKWIESIWFGSPFLLLLLGLSGGFAVAEHVALAVLVLLAGINSHVNEVQFVFQLVGVQGVDHPLVPVRDSLHCVHCRHKLFVLYLLH